MQIGKCPCSRCKMYCVHFGNDNTRWIHREDESRCHECEKYRIDSYSYSLRTSSSKLPENSSRELEKFAMLEQCGQTKLHWSLQVDAKRLATVMWIWINYIYDASVCVYAPFFKKVTFQLKSVIKDHAWQIHICDVTEDLMYQMMQLAVSAINKWPQMGITKAKVYS